MGGGQGKKWGVSSPSKIRGVSTLLTKLEEHNKPGFPIHNVSMRFGPNAKLFP